MVALVCMMVDAVAAVLYEQFQMGELAVVGTTKKDEQMAVASGVTDELGLSQAVDCGADVQLQRMDVGAVSG
ncbi:hypothetical protein C5167_003272 [Papaver somniferum]|uniref:Uncharacterized protein n=1 Tax=Papaver somniferum TaxID=3469 RepID=A0A4Y7L331_PAPSO|nr:hypothetical protein C5167_003272 [Papaver somniferum]